MLDKTLQSLLDASYIFYPTTVRNAAPKAIIISDLPMVNWNNGRLRGYKMYVDCDIN